MKKAIGIFLAITMILSLSVSVYAAAGEVTVEGHIGTTGAPSVEDPAIPGTYDITYTTAVHWWVTQANPTAVVDGDSSGPNPLVVNKIQNNNTATEVAVSLKSFDLVAGSDADNTTMQDYLDLRLKGDLAEDGVGSTNLNIGYSPLDPITYTELLKGGAANAWTYGFDGAYNATTLTTSYAPQYTLTLGFAFA